MTMIVSKRRTGRSLPVVVVAWLLLLDPAGGWAQPAPAESSAEPPAASTAPGGEPAAGGVSEYHGIPYLSGGVGEGARQELRAQAQDYNLQLTFAGSGGHYLSDVKVLVQERGGKEVLQATSEGPLFFVRLPPGRYTVTAEADGQAQHKRASVGGHGRTELVFSWKD